MADSGEDLDYDLPAHASLDPEAAGVRKSGRKRKTATFADGTAADLFIKKSLSDLEDYDSDAEVNAAKAQKEAKAAAAMAKLEAAFAVDGNVNDESDVEDVTAPADNAENDENEIPEILVGADGANPIKKAGRNKDGRQILQCNYDDECEFKTTNLGKMTNHIASCIQRDQARKHLSRKYHPDGRRRRGRPRGSRGRGRGRGRPRGRPRLHPIDERPSWARFLGSHRFGSSAHFPKERPFECEQCPYKAARKSHMASHMEFKHPADGVPKKVPPRPKRFKCSKCEYRAASKVIVAKHFRARHTEFGKYKCKECPYITSQKPNLDFHYKFKHEEMNTEACTMCHYTTDSEEKLRRHTRVVHDKWRYVECMACEYQAPTETHMNWHMQRVHGTMSRLDKARFGLKQDWHPEYDSVNYDGDYEDAAGNYDDYDYDDLENMRYGVKSEPGLSIKPDPASYADWNDDEEERREIEAMLKLKQDPGADSDESDDGQAGSGVRRSGRRKKPSRVAKEAYASLRAAWAKKEPQVKQEAPARPPPAFRPAIIRPNAETHLAQLQEASISTGEVIAEGPITYTPQALDQVTTYVVTDSTGEIVATEGGISIVTNEEASEEPMEQPKEDPNNLQFELTAVDDSGMPLTFQVAAMEQDEVAPQVVTYDATDVADDEVGGRESVKNSFQCNECFKVFKNRRQLSAHEAAVHLKEKPFACELCPYRASRKQHIKSHMETHKRRQLLQGEEGKIKCPQCDYSHDDQFYIDCHVKLHHEGAEKLVCPHCDFSSLTTYRLQKHVDSVHNKIKNFACELCDYRCAEKGSLRIHVQIVHERVKAYKCEHCDFAAYVSSHLTYHMRSKHEKRMDFECDECDKAFVDMRALRSHKSAVHLKEKPFKCTICDYRANRKQHIKVHMKTHMGTFMGTVDEAVANVEGPDEEPLDEEAAAIEEQIAEEEEAIVAEEEAAEQLAAVNETASEAERASGMEESEAESTASGSGPRKKRRKL